jgi:hypothetical protein
MAIQHAMVDSDSGKSVAQCATDVRAASQRGTRLSGAQPDHLVPQEDKDDNGWVTWRRTGH